MLRVTSGKESSDKVVFTDKVDSNRGREACLSIILAALPMEISKDTDLAGAVLFKKIQGERF